MANLVLLQGGQATTHPLTEPETVLGRHPACTIQLPHNAVSRRHAMIIREGEEYFIEDLNSGNGTFVNGKRVTTRVRLRHRDRIKLGPLLLRFESDGESSLRTPASGLSVIDAVESAPRPGGLTETDLDVDIETETQSTIMSVSSSFVLEVQPEVKLKAVLEITRSLAGTMELQSLLPKILDTLFAIFPQADRGCILLKDPETGKMIPRALKHRRADEDSSVKISRTIVKKVLTEKTGILSADASSDAQFSASESISNLSIRSMMCVPMLGMDGEPTGVIHIDTQNPLSQFQQEDLDLLMAVAGQAALSYETARLFASYVEKQKQDNEMQIARAVQRALLPESLPRVEGYDFYASYDSAQAVGGDFYDVIRLSDEKVCVSFGDVAGKGVPGALIMARMSSCVQNTMSFVDDVGTAIRAINRHMCDKSVEGRFVTYVLAIIDTKTHQMTLCNGGHMSPIIRRPDGTIEEFDEDTIGLPIGVIEDYPYEVVTRQIEPGEIMVLFTDGVDEAMNPEGTLYGMDRLRDFIRNFKGNAEELGRALLADVRRHANGRPQNDDITIMTIGRHPA